MNDIKNDRIFGLFKGEPGTRKSTAALSFPTPQYWISTDKKMNSLITPMKNWGINPVEIEYDNYDQWTPIIQRLEKFQINCKYKTIVDDSITSNADVINRQTMKFKAGGTTKAGDEKGHRIGGIPVNTMEDYKAEASAFQELIALLKDIHEHHGTNIVIIAHVIGERSSKDASGSTHFARIIVTGGKIISAKIPAYCSEVYHFNVEQSVDASKEGSYGLVTVHNGDDFARTALPLAPRIIFNNDKLYDKYLLPAINQQNQPNK
jgi:hypothetical protein